MRMEMRIEIRMEMRNGNENGNVSNIVNEGIRTILLFFLRENFISTKSTKSSKRHI